MQIHTHEQQFLDQYKYIIAVDEAGRGPWAGPVTVGAVLLDSDKMNAISGNEVINDSKKISEKKRDSLQDFIKSNSLAYAIHNIEADIIDEVNILEATKLGILACVEEIISVGVGLSNPGEKTKPLHSVGILIDGKFNGIRKYIAQLGDLHDKSWDVVTVIDGDALCSSISAASILAKVHRDDLMRKLHLKYPEYAFDKHKGYGTILHMERLALFGPCEIHRKSFAPIKALL